MSFQGSGETETLTIRAGVSGHSESGFEPSSDPSLSCFQTPLGAPAECSPLNEQRDKSWPHLRGTLEGTPLPPSPGATKHSFLHLHSNGLKGNQPEHQLFCCFGHISDTLLPHVAARSSGACIGHFCHHPKFSGTVGQEDCKTRHPKGGLDITYACV